ncbi:MAG: hypothetical protein ACUVUQ_08935 [Thermodesulfovibrionales bacterium]
MARYKRAGLLYEGRIEVMARYYRRSREGASAYLRRYGRRLVVVLDRAKNKDVIFCFLKNNTKPKKVHMNRYFGEHNGS